jgi:hypothetical protein
MIHITFMLPCLPNICFPPIPEVLFGHPHIMGGGRLSSSSPFAEGRHSNPCVQSVVYYVFPQESVLPALRQQESLCCSGCPSHPACIANRACQDSGRIAMLTRPRLQRNEKYGTGHQHGHPRSLTVPPGTIRLR